MTSYHPMDNIIWPMMALTTFTGQALPQAPISFLKLWQKNMDQERLNAADAHLKAFEPGSDKQERIFMEPRFDWLMSISHAASAKASGKPCKRKHSLDSMCIESPGALEQSSVLRATRVTIKSQSVCRIQGAILHREPESLCSSTGMCQAWCRHILWLALESLGGTDINYPGQSS